MQAAVKVIIVSRSGLPFPNPQGGAEIYALRQALGLARAGVEVVIVGQGALPAGPAGATLIFWDARLSGNTTSRSRAVYYFKVLALASRSGYQGVGGDSTGPRYPGHPLPPRGHRAHAPHARSATALVLTVHDLPFQGSDPVAVGVRVACQTWEQPCSRAPRHIEVGPLSRGFDRCLLTAGELGNQSTPNLGGVWPVAMDLNQALDPATSQRLASDAGIHGAFILSVGSLTGRKRMDLLVEAMRYLRAGGIILVVVGQGPLRAQLEHTLAASGMRGRVHLLDAVDASTLQALQQQAEAVGPCVRARRAPHLDNRVRAGGTPAVYAPRAPSSYGRPAPTSATWLPVLRLASPRR